MNIFNQSFSVVASKRLLLGAKGNSEAQDDVLLKCHYPPYLESFTTSGSIPECLRCDANILRANRKSQVIPCFQQATYFVISKGGQIDRPFN